MYILINFNIGLTLYLIVLEQNDDPQLNLDKVFNVFWRVT